MRSPQFWIMLGVVGEDEIEMSLTCEVCNGVGERAATTRSFTYKNRELKCLVFVSSCIVCGHRWNAEVHRVENLRQVARACRSASWRLRNPKKGLRLNMVR